MTRQIFWWLLMGVFALAGMAWGQARPGVYLQQYTSAIDDSRQPYVLYLPDPYVPAAPHPVVFIGHGFGAPPPTADTQPFGAVQRRYADRNGVLLVYLYGRGNTFYDGVGEEDFFAVLADLRGRFSLDENRLYFEGASMGATGAYRLGIRHPDILAAVGGCDGFCDYRHWVAHYYAPARAPSAVAPSYLPNLLMASSVDHAEDARWLHLLMTVDTADNSVDSAETLSLASQLYGLRKRVLADGYAFTLRVNYGGRHTAGYSPLRIYNFLLAQQKIPYPRQVTVKTTQLCYGSLYWVSIDRLGRRDTFARLDADVRGNVLTVQADNVRQCTFRLDSHLCDPAKPVRIRLNRHTVYTGPLGTITLYAREQGGQITGWSLTDPAPAALHKVRDLEGPIGAAFTRKFLVCYGASPSQPAETAANKADADAFCADWNAWMHADIAPRPDTEVTGADIAGSNLLICGTVESSALLRAMQPGLPILVTHTGILLGGRQYIGKQFGVEFVYPNPLNPTRLVVVSHRRHPAARVKELETLPWSRPDYLIFDTTRPAGLVHNQTPNKLTYLPDTYVDAGYFTEDWQLPVP